jgi:hypothetical protein
MPDAAASVLAPWANFSVLTGSAAAALTGLMFVVITIVTGTERTSRNPDGISTFSTPTVAHFGAALLVAAMLSAPWPSLDYPAALLGLTGLYGVVYVYRLMHRARRLSSYNPDLEDWAWYTVLPFVSYGAILAGAIMLPVKPGTAPFALAAGILLLIFIGIHNAWDVVTYLAIEQGAEPPVEASPPDPAVNP